MTAIDWFWLISFIIATAGCIHQLRQLLAMPEDRATAAPSIDEPREG
jgi:hypothetical protein